MARVASRPEYVNLKDEQIESVVKVLSSLNYSEDDLQDKICPYIAQWLHDNNVTIESTCLIISSVINIEEIQTIIDNIYDPDSLIPPFQKSRLKKFLKKKEYERLEAVIDVKELKGVVETYLDSETSIVTDFDNQTVNQVIHRTAKDGSPANKIIHVINAVPSELVVYDNATTNLGRSFKTTWISKESNRKWTIASEYGGASVKEIANELSGAGYCPNSRLVESAVTCMISSMIQKGMAVIKTDVDNKGVYYVPEEDSISVVDLDYSEPSNEEKAKAIKVLEKVHQFYTDNEAVLATVFKWGLMSAFSYSMKIAGNKLPWLYLKGTSQAGKTTIAEIMLYIYDEFRKSENSILGSNFDSPYKIGINVSQDCLMRVVSEPAGVFENKNNVETIKGCVENIIARSKHGNGNYRNISAFSPIVFTANNAVPDDDALINRFHIISFYYTQRKTEEQKKEFYNAFHLKMPSKSPLVNLHAFGKFAIRTVMFEPELLEMEWQHVADELLSRFYSSIDVTVPEWLLLWEQSESINEFDESVREDIRTFFLDEINIIRRKGLIRDEYGKVKSTLDQSEISNVTDFENDVWDMINTNVFNWCIPHVQRGGDKFLCLTQTFRKELKKHLDYTDNLKSISQILHWEYANVRFSDGSQKRCIKISLKEFLNFVYPRVGDIV